jgi:hypothetical protein
MPIPPHRRQLGLFAISQLLLIRQEDGNSHGFDTFARATGAPSAGPDDPPLYPGAPCDGESMSSGCATGIDVARTWMPELRQRRSSCPMCCRKARPRLGLAARSPASAKQGDLLFTQGILPSALRAGFAVRAAPAAQWLLFSWPRKGK